MLDDLVADQRIAAGVPATLRFHYTDGDGVAAEVDDPADVTVAVSRADGTELHAAGTATTAGTGDDAGTYSVALTASQASLGMLVATWSIAGAGTFTTHAEVVGRHYLTVAEMQTYAPGFLEASTPEIIAARLAAELEVEWICDRSFVERLSIVRLSGTGEATVWLPMNDIVEVTDVTVDGTALDADLYLYGQALEVVDDTWAAGRGNIAATVRWGLSSPFEDLKRVFATRALELHHSPDSGVLARARTYSPEGGGSYELDTANRYRTGNPEVDAVYQRRSLRPVDDPKGGVGGESSAPSGAPVSRSLDMDPQRGGLFHGWPA